MTDQQSAELPQPGVGSIDDPAAFVAAQFPAILVPPLLVVFPVWRNQFDPSPLPSLPQRVGVVAPVGDHPFRFLSQPAFWLRNADFLGRGIRKRNFRRRGTFQPNTQRNTLAVSQYHPLRSLATLGFTDCGARFFAGAKLPSRKTSSRFSRPSPSSAPSKVRQALSQIPSSSHCFSRRQ